MRRTTWLLVAALAVVSLAFGPTAQASKQTFFVGETAPGQSLLFTVVSGGPFFEPILLNTKIKCPVTGEQILASFSFFGFQIPIDHGQFALDFVDIQEDFRWDGTITRTFASGPFSFAFPAFDGAGGFQACTTGALTWRARPVSSAAARPSAGTATLHVSITKDAHGRVHIDTSR